MAVRIAPIGWDHPAWVGNFYPDDLPPEWRLAFFCNEFDTVVVPRGLGDPAVVAGWLAECGARTRFYLEGDGTQPQAREVARRLGDRFGGFLVADDPAVARWREGQGDLRALRAEIERLAAWPETLLVIEGDPPTIATLRAARAIIELLGIAS